jgi:hypothetical protein
MARPRVSTEIGCEYEESKTAEKNSQIEAVFEHVFSPLEDGLNGYKRLSNGENQFKGVKHSTRFDTPSGNVNQTTVSHCFYSLETQISGFLPGYPDTVEAE